MFCQPSETGIADDRQHPGARVAAVVAIDTGERSDAGLLHHIFGVVPAAGEPARKRKRIREVGHHHLAKPIAWAIWVHHSLLPARPGKTALGSANHPGDNAHLTTICPFMKG